MKTLILKSLDACNLRCAYCSVGPKEAAGALSEADMRRALRFFAERALAAGDREAQVIFHGGEPTLLPAEQYARCIQYARAECPDVQLHFSMQTNGVLLSDAYLNLFQTYSIRVGVSLDGGPEIHDGQRRDRAGNATHARVMQNIRAMQARGIPVAALTVVTKPALRAGLEFLRELDAMKIPLKINPLLCLGEAAGRPELALEPGGYGDYLIRVFEYAAENDLSLHLSPLAEMLSAILADARPGGCIYNPRCCRDFLCVDREGVLYPCGRFADAHRCALGTLKTGVTPEGEEVLRRLEARRTTALPEKCRACRWVSLCNAGCSADGASSPGEALPCAVCADQEKVFRYLHAKGLAVFKKQLLKERARLQRRLQEEGCDDAV